MARTDTQCAFSTSPKRGYNLSGQDLQFVHDMFMRHTREVEPADQVIHAEGRLKALDRLNTHIRIADNEAVTPERIELVDRSGILAADERVRPAATVLIAIV